MICNTATDEKKCQMEALLKDSSQEVGRMVTACTDGPTKQCMKDNGSRERLMDEAHMYGQMVVDMTANGAKTSYMAAGYTSGLMEECTREVI